MEIAREGSRNCYAISNPHFVWRCAVSPSNSPRKRTNDHGGLGGKAQPNTTIESPTGDGHYPASEEEKIESLHALRSSLSRFFTLLKYTGEEIDAAFAGQPFLPNLPADAPANRRRFYTYLEHHRQVTKLLCKACELWRLTFCDPIVLLTNSNPPGRKIRNGGLPRKS
jgi:hypothetical protein